MRKPNHLILDLEFNRGLKSRNLWAIKTLWTADPLSHTVNRLNLNKKFFPKTRFLRKPIWLKFEKHRKKFRVIPSNEHPMYRAEQRVIDGIPRVFTPVTKVFKQTSLDHFLQYSYEEGSDAFFFFRHSPKTYRTYTLKRSLIKVKRSYSPGTRRLGASLNLLNVHFLKKERLYTKLKYSRTPAYDIVSGGSAALLAGFLGFLISEKFGFELVDSGDFYYGLMYLVFLGFSLKPLALIADNKKGFSELLSIRRVLVLATTMMKLIGRFFKEYLK